MPSRARGGAANTSSIDRIVTSGPSIPVCVSQRVGERTLRVSAPIPEPACLVTFGEQPETGEMDRADEADQGSLRDPFSDVVGAGGGVEVDVARLRFQPELVRGYAFALPAGDRRDLAPPSARVLSSVIRSSHGGSPGLAAASLGPGPAPAAPHIANDVPQPQEEVALGIVIWNDAPMSSST